MFTQCIIAIKTFISFCQNRIFLHCIISVSGVVRIHQSKTKYISVYYQMLLLQCALTIHE
jgi:hypothetical protein